MAVNAAISLRMALLRIGTTWENSQCARNLIAHKSTLPMSRVGREIFKVSCAAIATDPTLAEGPRAMQEQEAFLVGIPRDRLLAFTSVPWS
jgi:hypothetical protein